MDQAANGMVHQHTTNGNMKRKKGFGSSSKWHGSSAHYKWQYYLCAGSQHSNRQAGLLKKVKSSGVSQVGGQMMGKGAFFSTHTVCLSITQPSSEVLSKQNFLFITGNTLPLPADQSEWYNVNSKLETDSSCAFVFLKNQSDSPFPSPSCHLFLLNCFNALGRQCHYLPYYNALHGFAQIEKTTKTSS